MCAPCPPCSCPSRGASARSTFVPPLSYTNITKVGMFRIIRDVSLINLVEMARSRSAVVHSHQEAMATVDYFSAESFYFFSDVLNLLCISHF